MSRSEPRTSVHSSKGRAGGDEDRACLVALAEDLEQQLCAGLGERDEAEFVDDEELQAGELLLEIEQASLVSGLYQLIAHCFRPISPVDSTARIKRDGCLALGQCGPGRWRVAHHSRHSAQSILKPTCTKTASPRMTLGNALSWPAWHLVCSPKPSPGGMSEDGP